MRSTEYYHKYNELNSNPYYPEAVMKFTLPRVILVWGPSLEHNRRYFEKCLSFCPFNVIQLAPVLLGSQDSLKQYLCFTENTKYCVWFTEEKRIGTTWRWINQFIVESTIEVFSHSDLYLFLLMTLALTEDFFAFSWIKLCMFNMLPVDWHKRPEGRTMLSYTEWPVWTVGRYSEIFDRMPWPNQICFWESCALIWSNLQVRINKFVCIVLHQKKESKASSSVCHQESHRLKARQHVCRCLLS